MKLFQSDITTIGACDCSAFVANASSNIQTCDQIKERGINFALVYRFVAYNKQGELIGFELMSLNRRIQQAEFVLSGMGRYHPCLTSQGSDVIIGGMSISRTF